MKKITLIAITLCLSGCAETGHLLGAITMIPVNLVKGTVNAATNYDEASEAINVPDIDQAGTLGHTTY